MPHSKTKVCHMWLVFVIVYSLNLQELYSGDHSYPSEYQLSEAQN